MNFMQQIFENRIFLIIIVCVFIIFTIYPLIKKEKRYYKTFVVKIYFNNNSTLTNEQYKKISIGAIYSEQQTAFINSLETGLDKDKIDTITGQWWGINTPEEAMDTLEYLQNKGFAYYFPYAYRAFLTNDEEQKKNIIINGLVPDRELSEKEEEEIREDIQKAYNQQHNLTETFEELKEDKIIENKEDIKQYGVVGWDCGRLNFLSRLCYDAGFITEEQAWYFINSAYDLAQKTFNSWDDFAKSYVIGRAMWGGKDNHNSGIASIAYYMLTDPKSPWKQIKW